MKNLALPRAVDAVVRVLRWHRRWIAAVAAFVAVLSGLSALQPHRTPTVAVAVAARDLPGGTRLAASDLIVVDLPVDAAPAGARDSPGALVGQVINAPVSARTPITTATVSTGPDLARPGFVVMAVPQPNAALAAILVAGTRVDLIATGKAGVVASDVRVVAAPAAESGMLSSGQRMLLIEVSPAASAALAAALDAGGLTVAVH